MKKVSILALAVTGIATLFASWIQPASAQKEFRCDVQNSKCRSGFSESFCQVINGQLQCSETGRCCTVAEQPVVRPSQVSLDGLEAIQAIQDMSQSVTLIAGKTTWARAYLSTNVGGPITVYGFLKVRNTSTGQSTGIFPRALAIVNPAQNSLLQAKRAAPLARQVSLDFIIPTSFAAGSLELELTGITNSATGASLACANCASSRLHISFACGAPLRLRIVGIAAGGSTGDTGAGRYCNVSDSHCPSGFSQQFCHVVNGEVICQELGTCCTPPKPPPVFFAPRPVDYALLRSWLTRAYPIGRLIATDALMVTQMQWPFSASDVNAELAVVRALDVAGGVDPRTHYLGLVSTAFGLPMRGKSSGIPSSPDPTVVASGPTGPPSAAGNVGVGDPDASFGDWYGGHELAHTFGRKHPGFCGINSSDDSNFPFPNGQLSTNDGAFTGLDVGDPANGIAAVVLPGTSSFDIMTYCPQPNWPSSYAYDGIRQRLMAEDPGACSTGSSSSPLSVQSGQFVSIVARVNLTLNTASILYVNRLARAQIPRKTEERKASIRVTDARGEVVDEYPVWLREDSDIRPEEQRRAIVDAIIPYSPAISRIELLLDGKVADQLLVSKHPPIVESVKVSWPTEYNASIAWKARDEDRDKLSYIVQVTSGSRRWETIAIGLQVPELTLTRDLIGRGKLPRVRVIANDGFHSSRPYSVAVRVP